MSLLKTGQCFTEELALNCPTIVACVTALPTGQAAVAGDRVLGKDGQFHALPAAADAQQLSISGNVISLTNGGNVTLPAQVAGPAFATPAETITGTSASLMVNPADLYARENIAAQTGLANNPASIPAPAAGQSPWGTTLLGERVHYMPGVGWKVVADNYHIETPLGVDTAVTTGVTVRQTFTAHRAGVVMACMWAYGTSAGDPFSVVVAAVRRNNDPSSQMTDGSYATLNQAMHSNASKSFAVAAGDTIEFWTYHDKTISGIEAMRSSLTYIS